MAQTVSYEVRLALILMGFVFLTLSYDLRRFRKYQRTIWFLILLLPLRIGWFIRRLAETNRAPFDFAEGESELVSGFNVEYSSGGFAILFMAEYGRILFIRGLFAVIIIGGLGSEFRFYFKLGLVMNVFILVRGTVPRFRYDKLIGLAWKIMLPRVLVVLIVVCNFIIFM